MENKLQLQLTSNRKDAGNDARNRSFYPHCNSTYLFSLNGDCISVIMIKKYVNYERVLYCYTESELPDARGQTQQIEAESHMNDAIKSQNQMEVLNSFSLMICLGRISTLSDMEEIGSEPPS